MAAKAPHDPAEMRDVPCQHCGAAFPLDQLSIQTRCPHCGFDQIVGQGTIDELSQYHHAVDKKLYRAGEEKQRVDAWRHWQKTHGKKGAGLKKAGALVTLTALLLLAIGGAGFGIDAWGLPKVAVQLSLWLLVPVYLALLFRILAGGGRRDRGVERAEAGSVAVACPQCGAPAEVASGQALMNCIAAPHSSPIKRSSQPEWSKRTWDYGARASNDTKPRDR
jgi:predicted RNA-binding Zn-ribbon protein involved in translation (DUF1610 family)